MTDSLSSSLNQKTETLSLHINPKLAFGLELLCRKHQKNKSEMLREIIDGAIAQDATEKTSEISSLLPCPFCDSEADLVEHYGLTANNHYTGHVRCVSCEMVYGETGWGKTREESNTKAIKSWNTRTTKPVSSGQIAKDINLSKTIVEWVLDAAGVAYAN